jgi:hypothetical protein
LTSLAEMPYRASADLAINRVKYENFRSIDGEHRRLQPARAVITGAAAVGLAAAGMAAEPAGALIATAALLTWSLRGAERRTILRCGTAAALRS